MRGRGGGCAAARGRGQPGMRSRSRPGDTEHGEVAGSWGRQVPPRESLGSPKRRFSGHSPPAKLKSKPGVPALGAVAGAKLGHPGDPPESTHELILPKERGTEGNFRSAEH